MKSRADQQTALAANTGRFKFRKYDTIGDPSAESDGLYLTSCFVNNGELLDIIRDCSDERGIVVGRTGAGKTALLRTLGMTEDRAINLNPHDLALGYISNSAVLEFFASLNVKMDLFYRALWRHVIVVELLKRLFEFSTDADASNPWETLRYRLQRKKTHLAALEYLRERGSEFWNTTEELIKEITIRAESELKAKVDVGLHQFLALGASGASRLTTEQRSEILQLGQDVVNRIQMGKLSEIMGALDEELLIDSQKRYFVLIDRLDEDWVDDPVRYRLVRALIETMRELNSKVRYAKVVIALRVDLLDRVLAATTDAGFQHEKYRALCLPITWTRRALEELLDRRINQLVQNRYSAQRPVGYRDLLPERVGQYSEPVLDYLLDRTLMRPRDVISFFNACAARAEGRPIVSVRQVAEAEAEYSHDRLVALGDEWSVHYPYLLAITSLLKGRPDHFKLSELNVDALLDLCVQVTDGGDSTEGGPLDGRKLTEDYRHLAAFAEGKMSESDLRAALATILWRIGMVGLKTGPTRATVWSEDFRDRIDADEIDDSTTVSVHKMYWCALGTKPS